MFTKILNKKKNIFQFCKSHKHILFIIKYFLNKFKTYRINICKQLNGIYYAILYMISKYI